MFENYNGLLRGLATSKRNIAKHVAKREELYFQTRLQLTGYEDSMKRPNRLGGKKPMKQELADEIKRQIDQIVKYGYASVEVDNTRYTSTVANEKKMCNSLLRLRNRTEFFKPDCFFELKEPAGSEIYGIGKVMVPGEACSETVSVHGETITMTIPYVIKITEAKEYSIVSSKDFGPLCMLYDGTSRKYCAYLITSCAF